MLFHAGWSRDAIRSDGGTLATQGTRSDCDSSTNSNMVDKTRVTDQTNAV